MGRGAAGYKGSAAARSEAPEQLSGESAAKEGPQEPARAGGAVCLDFFGKGLQESLLVLCQAPASST